MNTQENHSYQMKSKEWKINLREPIVPEKFGQISHFSENTGVLLYEEKKLSTYLCLIADKIGPWAGTWSRVGKWSLWGCQLYERQSSSESDQATVSVILLIIIIIAIMWSTESWMWQA